MRYRPEQLNAVLQKVLFTHLQELDELGPRSADDQPYVWETRADPWSSGDEQVDALAIGQPGEKNNCN